jgi:hypothetical protein
MPWGLVRVEICERDSWQCAICSVRRGLSVHHIVPRSRLGPQWPENLITLCLGCHDIVQSKWCLWAPTLIGVACRRTWDGGGIEDGASRFLWLVRAVTQGGWSKHAEAAETEEA